MALGPLQMGFGSLQSFFANKWALCLDSHRYPVRLDARAGEVKRMPKPDEFWREQRAKPGFEEGVRRARAFRYVSLPKREPSEESQP